MLVIGAIYFVLLFISLNRRFVQLIVDIDISEHPAAIKKNNLGLHLLTLKDILFQKENASFLMVYVVSSYFSFKHQGKIKLRNILGKEILHFNMSPFLNKQELLFCFSGLILHFLFVFHSFSMIGLGIMCFVFRLLRDMSTC